MRWRALAALVLLGLGASATAAPACRAAPLQGRELFLRGTFNGWSAADAYRLRWACNHFEAVLRLQGEQRFKVGDEAWSADADWGAARGSPGALPATLALTGGHLVHTFRGTQRLSLFMDDPTAPRLAIEDCPAPPLGDTVLYLRGQPSSWAPVDEYAFQYSCDAYYLNVNFKTRQEFKIADAQWTPATTYGIGAQGQLVAGGENIALDFQGEHTLRLAFEQGRPRLTLGPKTFPDAKASTVTDPVALSLKFDSRASAHKAPFGAVPAGSTVSFSVSAAPGVKRLTLVIESRRLEGNQEVLEYREQARVPMTVQREGGVERWSANHHFDGVGVFGYWFEAQIGEQVYTYQNNADSIYWTRERGSGGVGAVVERPAAPKTIRRFRQTVYDPAFKVPAWGADAVFYFIFPERFRNGDRSNDPQPGRYRFHRGTAEFHQNWLDRPWRPKSGDGSDDLYNNDFFGGDLAGIIEKLDDIRDLGANTIYMTPIFQAASNHKYDTADYRHVDPAFGTDADFTRLTQEAARRGIRVITDTSLNHTGSDSVYFNRYGNFRSGGAFEGGRVRADSPYASWYRFDTTQTNASLQYKGWGGPDLPELDKSSASFRRFAYGAPDSVMTLWLDRGASGWRMDVAPWVPDDFWREWRSAIKGHRPDALTIAETWFDASKFLLGDMFDSTMNYVFRNTVLDYAAGGQARALYDNLEWLREAYPPQALHALMNLLSSHDQARALHHLGWRDDAQDAATVALAKARLKLAVFFQMSYPGAPAVYYGDEVGMTGGDDPYNRGPYPWADLGGQPDQALRAEFKKLIGLRQQHPVLRHGSLLAPLHADDHVIVLARRWAPGAAVQWAITATNNASSAQTVTVTLPAEATGLQFVDALSGEVLNAERGRLRLTVPALYGRVLTAVSAPVPN